MKAYRVSVTGFADRLVVDTPASNIAALVQEVASPRFLIRYTVEPDGHGLCMGVYPNEPHKVRDREQLESSGHAIDLALALTHWRQFRDAREHSIVSPADDEAGTID